jgi:hypothetical protein
VAHCLRPAQTKVLGIRQSLAGLDLKTCIYLIKVVEKVPDPKAAQTVQAISTR